MTLATSIRSTIRNLINDLGGDATLYSFSSATKSLNEEGDYSVSSWGTGTTIKVVSTNNYKLRRLLEIQGEVNNAGDRVLIIRDDVTIAHRDKITLDGEDYLVNEIKLINPIENILIAQRIVLAKDINY